MHAKNRRMRRLIHVLNSFVALLESTSTIAMQVKNGRTAKHLLWFFSRTVTSRLIASTIFSIFFSQMRKTREGRQWNNFKQWKRNILKLNKVSRSSSRCGNSPSTITYPADRKPPMLRRFRKHGMHTTWTSRTPWPKRCAIAGKIGHQMRCIDGAEEASKDLKSQDIMHHKNMKPGLSHYTVASSYTKHGRNDRRRPGTLITRRQPCQGRRDSTAYDPSGPRFTFTARILANTGSESKTQFIECGKLGHKKTKAECNNCRDLKRDQFDAYQAKTTSLDLVGHNFSKADSKALRWSQLSTWWSSLLLGCYWRSYLSLRHSCDTTQHSPPT